MEVNNKYQPYIIGNNYKPETPTHIKKILSEKE